MYIYVLPVISGIDDISSVDVMAFSSSSQTTSSCDYVTGITNRLVILERRLKALEHVRITTVVVIIVQVLFSLSYYAFSSLDNDSKQR